MSKVDSNAIHFEYIFNFFDNDPICSFDSISFRNIVDVIRIQFVQVKNITILEHFLCNKQKEFEKNKNMFYYLQVVFIWICIYTNHNV